MNASLDPVDTTGERKDDKDLILEAMANFDLAVTAYTPARTQAREDLKFVAGKQADTATDGDPYALQVNLLNPFLRQITAEIRTANPAVRVVAQDDEDVDTAEIRGGLIRAIEQDSNSEYVYQNAVWYAAASGEGYFFIDTEYVADDSFDQNLLLKACPNPEMVFIDPSHTEPTGKDCEWGFVIKDIPTAAYRRQFPKSELNERLGTTSWSRLTLPKQWLTENTVRVAQYWVKQYTQKKLWLVQNPQTLEQYTMDTRPGDDVVLLRKEPRIVQVAEVKGYTINGIEVLEKIDWPGTRIPIFKVPGDTFYIGGEKTQFGAVRQAIDCQRQYNYAVSRQTEMVDMAPKSPWIITTKQLGNNAEKWANSNRIGYGYLDYNNEQGAQAPYKAAGINQSDFGAVVQSREQAYEDMKRVFGLNDASMGSVSKGAMSGVAIDSQVEQGSRSTYQYFDNLLLAIKECGRELNDLFPYFYDTDRLVRIVKPTNEDQVVAINSMSNDKRYDLTKGNFAISVTTGPAYASKRQEAYTALSGIMNALPQAGAVIGDLVASQVDSPVAKLAAARIKATIPPEILAATEENGDLAPREQLQAAKAQVAQLSQQTKQMGDKLQELDLENKQMKDQAALELTKADMEHEIKKGQLKLDEQVAEVEARLTKMKLDLESRKLDLAEKELEMKSLMAAHEVNESGRPEKEEVTSDDFNITLPNVEGDTTDIGGKMD
jgi:hypothetical protein